MQYLKINTYFTCMKQTKGEFLLLNAEQIQEILPHRYPFLLVDRIFEIEEGKRAVGIKNVSINEEFFNGHFPGYPVMPGVLIVEALAQVGGVALLKCASLQRTSCIFNRNRQLPI